VRPSAGHRPIARDLRAGHRNEESPARAGLSSVPPAPSGTDARTTRGDEAGCIAGARLAAATAARGARRDGGGLELLEVLEHADHRVARRRVRLVGDRAPEADAELCAELRLDQPVRA